MIGPLSIVNSSIKPVSIRYIAIYMGNDLEHGMQERQKTKVWSEMSCKLAEGNSGILEKPEGY